MAENESERVQREDGRSHRVQRLRYPRRISDENDRRDSGSAGRAEIRVSGVNRVALLAAAHSKKRSCVLARVKSEVCEYASRVVPPFTSVPLGVELVAVVARDFVGIETGFGVGGFLPKNRFTGGDFR